MTAPPTPYMGQRVHTRWPRTDEELWWWIWDTWGMRIPRQRVCADHQAPFDAFANAFFARSPVAVWKASRGFGGKSVLMGLLALTEAVILGADSSVLGGSAAQSQRVLETTRDLWFAVNAPKSLEPDHTQWESRLNNGAKIRALMASPRSVRGPHPERLRLDEIDEMELDILESAQGQPMTTVRAKAQTVMSSTHQYPDKTMTKILNRAVEKGWPIYQWCWRETSNPIDGWLTPEAIEQKRSEVSEVMWLTEYDLQEPSFAGRAINGEKVEAYFDREQGTYVDVPGKALIFEPFEGGATYITGVDWAKERDWTVIDTFRTDCRPWQRVAWERVNRKPWPEMVTRVIERTQRYPGLLAHDATGIGNVVGDMLATVRERQKVMDVVLNGRTREAVFNEYIAAVEADEFRSPWVEFPYNEHKYVRQEDLYGRGHPPDSFVAAAVAWYCRTKGSQMEPPMSVTRDNSPWELPSAIHMAV